jgi:alginate O-acetyltransferase complex protein AlgJ
MTKTSHSPGKETPLEIKITSSNLASGIVFFLVILFGFVSTFLEVINHDLNLFPKELSISSFMSGKTAADIATSLKKSNISEKSAQFQRLVSWQLFQDLGADVRLGAPGWLFLNDEFLIYENSNSNMISKVEEIKKVNDFLLEKGIILQVLLLPDKSRVQFNQLGNLKRSNTSFNRVNHFEELLSKANINVLNTQELFLKNIENSNLFLKADTHWNEDGAQLVANELGQKLIKSGCYPSPKMEVSYKSELKIRPGDLVKLAGLDWVSSDYLPAVDNTQSSTFTYNQINTSKTSSDDNLFGDEDLPNIALIGTSYSNNSHFADFLGRALNTKIGNFAKDGGDFSGSMNNYLVSRSFRDTPPRCLVWEIPERVIQKKSSTIQLRQK